LGESPGVGAALVDQRDNATTFALHKWRDGWVAAKLHTHPAQTVGLYQEKGMMWWVLAKFLHQKKGLSMVEGGMGNLKDSERIVSILKILKAIHKTVESGGIKEENLSPEAVRDAASPRNVGVSDDEGLNSMTISYIMSRKAP
jgi:hypothetical protein